MRKQIILIHGGDAFDSYDEYLSFMKEYKFDQEKFNKKFREKGWKSTLGERLGDEFEVIQPIMPNKENARYAEWKMWLEKLIPFFDEEVILIGHSQGGIFLAKYLSENDFPKKIKATFLIAAPYDDTDKEYSLVDFKLPDNLKKLQDQSHNLFVYHSKDDPIVPFVDALRYQKDLPDANVKIFEDKGHFSIEEFPELVSDIKNL